MPFGVDHNQDSLQEYMSCQDLDIPLMPFGVDHNPVSLKTLFKKLAGHTFDAFWRCSQ